MLTIGATDALVETIKAYKNGGKSIGFVPTMGALHEGHLSLIRHSTSENDVTVVSIFVNPLQFNNASDLEKYPRVIDKDIELLGDKHVDVVFMPSESELYPQKPIVSIDFGELATSLEGEHRPGHFEGVGIVVSKFLHLVQPTHAYFGLKDLQQYIIIRRMCLDLNFPCKIVGVETVREDTGLAKSSRNLRLTEDGKTHATVIFKGLELIREGINQGTDLRQLLLQTRSLYDQTKEFELEYLEAVNPFDLSKVDSYDTLDELAVCVAGYVEGIRLIDNLYLRLK